MNILILGGSGFIGSNIAKQLIDDNHKIIIFDHYKANWKNVSFIKKSFKIIKGDFLKIEQISKIFEKNNIQLVIHLISTILPSSSHNKIIQELNLNLISTMKLIEQMNLYNVKKIIFFSSGGTVYGNNKITLNKEISDTNPINYYGWLKISIEKYLHLAKNLLDINYLIIRPSNAYGLNQPIKDKQGIISNVIYKIFNNQQIQIWGDGTQIRDFINVKDIAKAISKLIDNDKYNEIYNLGSGRGYSINQILNIIQNITNKKLNIKHFPKRKIDVLNNILDIQKIKNATNWQPEISITAGIKEYWQSNL